MRSWGEPRAGTERTERVTSHPVRAERHGFPIPRPLSGSGRRPIVRRIPYPVSRDGRGHGRPGRCKRESIRPSEPRRWSAGSDFLPELTGPFCSRKPSCLSFRPATEIWLTGCLRGDKPVTVSRAEEQTVGKFRSGNIVDAGEPGRVLQAMRGGIHARTAPSNPLRLPGCYPGGSRPGYCHLN